MQNTHDSVKLQAIRRANWLTELVTHCKKNPL